jgi:HK97 gp10 family phage protein
MTPKRNNYGDREVSVTIEDFSQPFLVRFNNELTQAMQAITLDATNEMLDLVTKYQTVEQGPSKHPNPPHQFTGRLADSLPEARDVRSEPNRVIGIVGSTVEYALWLERGTRYMASRPFIRPAVKQTEKKITNILRRFLKDTRP